MKQKVQSSRMYLAGLALLLCSSLAWAMPSQWLTNADEMAAAYDVKLGDVNGDGEIKINDVTMLVDVVIGKIAITDEIKAAGDVNKDGEIKINDVTMLVDVVIGKVQLD